MSDNTIENKRIAKNSVYMFIRMLFVLCINLYTTRVILEVLGVEEYGVYNVVVGFVALFSFINNSLAGSTQRFFNYELGKNGLQGAQQVYVVSILIHLLLGIIVVAASEPVGLWYIRDKMVLPEGSINAAIWVFHFSVVSLFINILSAPYVAAVLAHEKMNAYAIIGVIDAINKLAIVYALQLLESNKLIWYGALYMTSSLVMALLFFVYAKCSFVEIKLKGGINSRIFRQLLSFSGWNVFGSFAYVLREQGVNLVLNAFWGPVVNAAKGISNQINGALQSFISNITTPTKPQVVQSYARGDENRSWTLTYSISKLSCIFFFAVAMPICLEVEYLLNLWLGDNIPEHTELFIIFLLSTNVFGTLVMPISSIVSAAGKIKYYQLLSSASNILTVPLAYIFIRSFHEPEAIYLALFITMVTNHIVGLLSAKKHAKLSIADYFHKVILPLLYVIVIAIPIPLILRLLMPESFFRLVIVSVVGCLSTCLLAYSFALTKEERNLVNGLLHKLRNKVCTHHSCQ